MLQLPLPVSIIGDKPEMEVQDSKIDEEQKQCDDKVNLECSQNDLEDGELEEPGEILDDQIYEQTSGDSINLKLDYNALHEATHENVNTNVTENAQSKQSDSDDSESVASEMDLGLDSDSDIDNIPVKVQDREKLLLAIDETENMDAAKDPIRSKNEMDLPPVEPIDVVIPEDAILLPIGSIVSKVGDTILVEAFESGEEKVLDIDSVLVFEDKTILGKISDTFGPVLQPFYSIRKNLEDLEKLDLVIGQSVFYVPNLVNVIMTTPLKDIKGSDASNLYDEEVGDNEMEFSDDEQELQFKRKRKGKSDRPSTASSNDAIPPGPMKRGRQRNNSYNNSTSEQHTSINSGRGNGNGYNRPTKNQESNGRNNPNRNYSQHSQNPRSNLNPQSEHHYSSYNPSQSYSYPVTHANNSSYPAPSNTSYSNVPNVAPNSNLNRSHHHANNNHMYQPAPAYYSQPPTDNRYPPPPGQYPPQQVYHNQYPPQPQPQPQPPANLSYEDQQRTIQHLSALLTNLRQQVSNSDQQNN